MPSPASLPHSEASLSTRNHPWLHPSELFPRLPTAAALHRHIYCLYTITTDMPICFPKPDSKLLEHRNGPLCLPCWWSSSGWPREGPQQILADPWNWLGREQRPEFDSSKDDLPSTGARPPKIFHEQQPLSSFWISKMNICGQQLRECWLRDVRSTTQTTLALDCIKVFSWSMLSPWGDEQAVCVRQWLVLTYYVTVLWSLHWTSVLRESHPRTSTQSTSISPGLPYVCVKRSGKRRREKHIHPTFSPLENMLLKISCKSEVWNIQIFTHYTSGVEVVIRGEGATKNYEILIVVSMIHFF